MYLFESILLEVMFNVFTCVRDTADLCSFWFNVIWPLLADQVYNAAKSQVFVSNCQEAGRVQLVLTDFSYYFSYPDEKLSFCRIVLFQIYTSAHRSTTSLTYLDFVSIRNNMVYFSSIHYNSELVKEPTEMIRGCMLQDELLLQIRFSSKNPFRLSDYVKTTLYKYKLQWRSVRHKLSLCGYLMISLNRNRNIYMKHFC